MMAEKGDSKCRICGNEQDNISYTAREMMYGLKDEFDYFQCSQCQCLQIEEIPADIAKFYPDNYYSFSAFDEEKYQGLKGALKKLKLSSAIFKETPLQQAVNTLLTDEKYGFLRELEISRKSRILDVGCGNGGKFLYPLSVLGLKHLLGCDPFISEPIEYESGLQIKKTGISGIDGKWDLVIFNHAYEHVPNPIETMQKVSSVLSQEGVCVLRIPTVSSYAWQHYKTDWFQLDAPRHFFLHSRKSMEIVAEKAGLEVFKVYYDSGYQQFSESEKYQNDISLLAPRPKGFKHFLRRKFRKIKYQRLARRMNRQQQGDQAAFFLRRAK